jgi:hypothetical protein
MEELEENRKGVGDYPPHSIILMGYVPQDNVVESLPCGYLPTSVVKNENVPSGWLPIDI